MSGFSTATLLQAQRKGQDLRSVCFGMSLEMEEAIGAILDETTPKWTFIATGLILTAFEMYAYSEIFKFLTKNNIVMIGILPERSIAKRKNQNAIVGIRTSDLLTSVNTP